ncbi:hypothetical protein HRF69_23835 [Bacillus circulans]|uniref:hypothetical protein n=1 Tax=Niallia circulans TaxID=1397 RepID=UPI00155F9AE7|nr:hypothetical protein [Niallia circulans]NRG30115.1 hypothetical protein [Niallia circulans]
MKIMKYSKTLLILSMIVPWVTVPLLGKNTLKRYIAASTFIALMVRLTNIVAKRRKWWWWYEKIHPRVPGDIPFMLGSFFVGSIWILKWTYGKFFTYMGINMAFDSMFTYVIVPYLTKFGIASLVRISKMQLMYVFTVLALILYAFQFLYEKIPFNRGKLKHTE